MSKGDESKKKKLGKVPGRAVGNCQNPNPGRNFWALLGCSPLRGPDVTGVLASINDEFISPLHFYLNFGRIPHRAVTGPAFSDGQRRKKKSIIRITGPVCKLLLYLLHTVHRDAPVRLPSYAIPRSLPLVQGNKKNQPTIKKKTQKRRKMRY